MAFLSEAEKKRLRARIEDIERRTSGELVTVIARQSDNYPFIPLLWASMVALSLPAIASLAELRLDLAILALAQMGCFLVLAFTFRWPPLKMRLIPKRTKLRRAARTARELFLEMELHHTEHRCGVMIFVSVGEHYVEILADRGINEKVEQAEWDAIVADFIQSVKQGEVASGFERAVNACGDLLVTHFPRTGDGRKELPDHLIEI